MKAILMSIKPQHVANILNKLKTLEIRKRFPSDYVGWVYIYCTKNGKQLVDCPQWAENELCHQLWYDENIALLEDDQALLNGKVVARFWCDKVEEITIYQHKAFFNDGYEKEPTIVWQDYHTKSCACGLLEEPSCLTYEELHDYLKGQNGYAIHITNLEIFDKPKEIKEFRRYCDKHFNWWTNKCLGCKAYTPDTDIEDYCNKNKLALTRAPESWCYAEI